MQRANTPVTDTRSAQAPPVQNEKLAAAIARVLTRGGADVRESRYDRQHHRHNKG